MDPITSVSKGDKIFIAEQGHEDVFEILKVGDGAEGERLQFPATDPLGDATCDFMGQASGYAQPLVDAPLTVGTVYRKFRPLPPNQGGQYAQLPCYFQTAESGRVVGDYDQDSDTFVPWG